MEANENKCLVTVYLNSTGSGDVIRNEFEKIGLHNSFLRDGKSYDLPSNMYVKPTIGSDQNAIRDAVMDDVNKIMQAKGLSNCSVGVFVGKDWTQDAVIDYNKGDEI
ncbi:MAG: hypothetical protein LBH49_03705 [Puniceicoccales bacterium]|jgi:hypothetical protein|nr:hypothetical protein [Puniceicoccales bacterium]